jgi:sugar/nucleoside kinase (ribokinase family)
MLVEIMRIQLDEPFDRIGTFAGPFPSGDTPVYVNAVARLGRSAGFMGAVGDDGFGRCILNRFAEQGVDATHVRVLPDRITGIAFVSYASDGSRKFIFHWKEAAAGQIGPDYVPAEYCAGAAWLHLTGGNLVITPASYAACLRALECVPRSARVSFDPNIRAEWLETADIRGQWRPIVERADYILPSGGEAALLTGAESDEEGCRQLAALGKVVVQKLGKEGCRVFADGQEFAVSGFDVPEADPTGAGDTFCAGFTVAMLDGLDLPQAAIFANAVGALAVTRKGPMEGAPTRQEVASLIATQPPTIWVG